MRLFKSTVKRQDARPGRSGGRLLALAALAAVGTLGATGARAEEPSGPFFLSLPEEFGYAHWNESPEQSPPSFSFERNESRAVRAPTRYRTKSILRYEKALGRTGLILRVKAPLKPRKIVKFELRF
jgi:hypothetical protein